LQGCDVPGRGGQENLGRGSLEIIVRERGPPAAINGAPLQWDKLRQAFIDEQSYPRNKKAKDKRLIDNRRRSCRRRGNRRNFLTNQPNQHFGKRGRNLGKIYRLETISVRLERRVSGFQNKTGPVRRTGKAIVSCDPYAHNRMGLCWSCTRKQRNGNGKPHPVYDAGSHPEFEMGYVDHRGCPPLIDNTHATTTLAHSTATLEVGIAGDAG